MLQGGAGGYGPALTPKFNDINEILNSSYAFPGLVPPVGFGGYGDMSAFLNPTPTTGTTLDGGARFGGMSPHPHFYSPSMAKMNVDVSATPHHATSPFTMQALSHSVGG